MSDLSKNLRTILGREIDLSTASYYEIVGLPRDERDPKVIETALRATVLFLKNVRESSSPEAWMQVAQLVQQAKQTLLDPEKKRAYDARLHRRQDEPVKTASPIPPVEVAVVEPKVSERERVAPEVPLDVPGLVAVLPKHDLAKRNEVNWKEFASALSVDPALWA